MIYIHKGDQESKQKWRDITEESYPEMKQCLNLQVTRLYCFLLLKNESKYQINNILVNLLNKTDNIFFF